MGIKERKQRQRDDTRLRIVSAALRIGKEEGWHSLSMRKIGEVIEYSAPIIYEYFANKEALLHELTRLGYSKLNTEMQIARKRHEDPAKQLEAMWLIYWKFAFNEKEFYQLMFGIEINRCDHCAQMPEADMPEIMISDAIRKLLPEKSKSDERISRTYYTFWSVVHGLISLNMIGHCVPDAMNHQVLHDAINGIIGSMAMV